MPIQRILEGCWQSALFLVGLSLSVVGCSEGQVEPAPKHIDAPQRETTAINGVAPFKQPSDATSLLRSKQPVPTPPRVPMLLEVAEVRNLNFTYDTGSNGQSLMVESTGGGAGWVDYDRDGLLDLYCVQGGNPLKSEVGTNPNDSLFRQIDGQFERAASAAKIVEADYGQGLAVGDFNDDGFDDIYVTNVGQDRLWQNLGDGTFIEISQAAGLQWNAWKSSAAWYDLDNDSDLDLYVCSYTDYDVFNPKPCSKANGEPGVCHPESVNGVPDECFQNNGDGTFSKVASHWGLVGDGSKSLGVVIADLTEDGQPDIYVANDTTANYLFVQHRPGSFVDEAIERGCALNGAGMFQASMGVAAGDYDHNGHLDLYVTHFTHDYNTLYSNVNAGVFVDTTSETGLVKPTYPFLGFGTVLVDFNTDKHCDLLVANGHIDDWRDRGNKYKMNLQLFSFDGLKWTDQTAATTSQVFKEERLSRAIATADFDNDSDVDCVIINQNDPLWLLENQSEMGPRLQVTLIGRQCNRRAIGAVISVRQGDFERKAWLAGGSSYCAAHDLRPVLPIESYDMPVEVVVTWPGQHITSHQVVAGQRTVTLIEPDE